VGILKRVGGFIMNTVTVEKVYESTKGKKTVIATAAWLTMRIINSIEPDLIPVNYQLVIYDVIELLAVLGITDKLWRNRKEFAEWVVKNKKEFTAWVKNNIVLIKNLIKNGKRKESSGSDSPDSR
jgi:hypothetical protein